MNSSSYNFGFVIWITVVSAMGGLLFGYDWVVIGGAKPFYERYFSITLDANMQGFAMGAALLGCIAGAIGSGWLSDRFGRKRPLIAAAAIFLVSSLGTGISSTVGTFAAWRIIGGIAIGLASSLSPMYIAEIAPASMRGRLVSVNQLTIVIGILLAQIVNFLIAEAVPPEFSDREILLSWNGQMGWRWMFWVTALPSLVFFVVGFTIPESPRWLIKQKRTDRARAVLRRIGGQTYAEQAAKEIESTLVHAVAAVDMRSLAERRLRPVLVIGIVLAVFQQWCGINVIFNYAEEIFTSAGYGVSDTLFNIVITGVVNLLSTFVAMSTVDRWGRRGLMLIGSLGLALIYGLLGGSYFLHTKGTAILVFVVLGIATYAMSLAPVTWVLLSEIFPNRIRGAAMAVATASLWIACFILTYTFPLLNHSLGAAGTFWVYAIICLSGFIFIFRTLPETKGKSLEQVEVEMQRP